MRLALMVILPWAAAAALTGCGVASSPMGTEAVVPPPSPPSPSLTGTSESPHLRFGVPLDADPSDDYLMDKGGFVLSYNPARGLANWVAWRVTPDDLGDTARTNSFRADDQLPRGFRRAMPGDYAHSGYDRGHLCPSAHRAHDSVTNAQTFVMSNMLPQHRALNAGPWRGIEQHERELVKRDGKHVYVVAGGLFSELPSAVGRGLAVPRATFRVTLVVEPGSGPGDVSKLTPLLAVEMPNDASAKGRDWRNFRVAVDKLETDTGYDFLSDLPDEIEGALEAMAP